MSLSIERGRRVTRDQVCAVETPEATDTYKPIPYEQILQSIESGIERKLQKEIHKAEYGLSQKDKQLFAVYTLKGENGEHGPAIGARQSLNKSIAPAVAGGLGVFVCDNLCFSGDSFKFIRKNTKNVWEDWLALLDESLELVPGWYESMTQDMAVLKAIPCSLERGWEIIGHAQHGGNRVEDTRCPKDWPHTEKWEKGKSHHWENVLAPQQATIVSRDWVNPRYAEFSPRNLWSLYNDFTEAVKVGPAGQRIQRQTAVHSYFSNVIKALPSEVLNTIEVGVTADHNS